MKNLLSLDDLNLIKAIGASGALTAAARLLQLDHSTAFRRLGAVEQRLGARLFERSRNGYTPTLAGESAIAAATRLLDEMDDLERQLAGKDLRPSGTVRVTTTDTLAALVTMVFAALRAQHPEITIDLTTSNSFFALRKRDADIAVRPADAAPEHLAGRRLAALATAPYAVPDYLARHPRTELFQHDWLGVDESLQHLASARWLGSHVEGSRIVYRANSLLALQMAARAGMGVAALPCYLGDRDPSLRRVHPPLPELEVSLWLLTHPDLKRVARVRTVLDFVARKLAEQRDLIEGRRPRD
jgi:DNA-binding transcriptional LysR family regulator